jgi:hypothetical protein
MTRRGFSHIGLSTLDLEKTRKFIVREHLCRIFVVRSCEDGESSRLRD